MKSQTYLEEVGRINDEGIMAAEDALEEEDESEVTVRILKMAMKTLQGEVGFAIPALVATAEEAVAAEALSKKTSDLHKEHGAKLFELKRKIAMKAPEEKEAKPEVKAEGVAMVGGVARIARKEPVKIKPIDCPVWDGKYRTFARFKKIWDENITLRNEDSALHLMLVQSLPKSVLDNISLLTDSADDIWRYLENKYGRRRRLLPSRSCRN